ncbi:MAG: peptidoglycan peptidase, partial [Spirochaetae bacterium HGW-Spirochaetae-6]
MKKLIGLILLSCLSLLPSPASPSKPFSPWKTPAQKATRPVAPQDGDLIFQHSRSPLSRAIQLATRSPYSHCGLIYRRRGAVFVLEAIQPVSLTPLKDWIKRGKNGHYVLMRLKDSSKVLTPEIWQKM